MDTQPVRDVLQLLHGLGLGLVVVRHDDVFFANILCKKMCSVRLLDVEYKMNAKQETVLLGFSYSQLFRLTLACVMYIYI